MYVTKSLIFNALRYTIRIRTTFPFYLKATEHDRFHYKFSHFLWKIQIKHHVFHYPSNKHVV